MNLNPSEGDHREDEKTLLAVKQFNRFLSGMERDLSRVSKRLHNRETTQSAGFVTTGIHEARQYLENVRKVIERTLRVAQNSPKSAREASIPSPRPLVDEEVNSRIFLETWKGVEIWQGRCESCDKDTRIASDGSRYLCVDCLENPKSTPRTQHFTKVGKNAKKRSTSKGREKFEGGNILFKTREYIRRAMTKIR